MSNADLAVVNVLPAAIASIPSELIRGPAR
jgi:hypothetical protein